MIDITSFPKGAEKLKEFFRANLKAFQKNIMKEAPKEILEMPEISDEMVGKYMEASLMGNHRILLDFFDTHKLYITIDMFQGKFFGRIIGSQFKTKEWEERVSCEQEVMEEAFKQLEETL